MTNLTEQWKKDELEWDREYYVDLENNGIVKQLYLDEDGCFFDGIIDYSLKNKPYMEVLAPVPSYEKWQELKSHDEKATIKLGEACIENLKLKELLKECREFFYENLIDTEFYFSCGLGSDIKKQSCIRSLSKLTTKIDNAIGEKK